VVCGIQPNGSSDAYRRWKLASSQFLPGHAAFSGVPQVNMPMFPTGMNDKWHGAFTYNTSSYIMCFIFDDLYIAILN
jgi:hypothetical protein